MSSNYFVDSHDFTVYDELTLLTSFSVRKESMPRSRGRLTAVGMGRDADKKTVGRYPAVFFFLPKMVALSLLGIRYR